MNITLPLWLVVSQWTLLFALGVLVLVVYRQIGFMVHLKDIGTEREGLAIGEEAPAFDCTFVSQNKSISTRFEPKEGWSLLVFADPGCVSCQSSLSILELLTPKLGKAIRTLILTSADSAQIAAIDAFRTTSLDICRVSGEVSIRLYNTHITPFAYLIDAEGIIRSKGIATDESAIRKIVYGIDRNIIKVESITT